MQNKVSKVNEWTNPVNFLMGSTNAQSGMPVNEEVIETFEQR